MLKVDETWITLAEETHPRFREIVMSFEDEEFPCCPSCGNCDTAKVSAGMTSMSIHVAAATTKIRLLQNGHASDYYCNVCGEYFD